MLVSCKAVSSVFMVSYHKFIISNIDNFAFRFYASPSVPSFHSNLFIGNGNLMTTTVKLGQCFICGFDCKRNDPLRHVSDGKNDDSVAKILEYAQKRSKHGDSNYIELAKREGCDCKSYHLFCYRKLVNSTNLARLEQSFQRSLVGGGNGLPIRKERPSTSTCNSEDQCAKKTRLKRITTLYDSGKCIFCQYEENSDLHEVQTANMGKRVMEVLQKSKKESYNVIAKCFSDPLDVQPMIQSIIEHA